MKHHKGPYTYLIGWSKLDKWYYGVRFAKNCCTDDLWEKYFTSSKFVKEYREEHGEPDVIMIRKIFEEKREAIEWESKVLRKLYKNPKLFEKFLNQSINGKFVKFEKTKEWREKIGNSLRGKKKTKEHKEKLSKYRKENHHMFGKKRPIEHTKKISEGHLKRKHYRFSGYYITPWGVYPSAKRAQTNKVTDATLRRWCKNSKDIISNQSYSNSEYLKDIGQICVGKSYQDLGFYFVKA